jgi:hypothetical protein
MTYTCPFVARCSGAGTSTSTDTEQAHVSSHRKEGKTQERRRKATRAKTRSEQKTSNISKEQQKRISKGKKFQLRPKSKVRIIRKGQTRISLLTRKNHNFIKLTELSQEIIPSCSPAMLGATFKQENKRRTRTWTRMRTEERKEG